MTAFVCDCLWVRLCVHVLVREGACVVGFLFVYMCVCVCVCVCVCARGRVTERERERE